ncbi:protamine-like isoform X2 [Scaptodrosophila lebanonensis]|nr:protamine-like isoform X2 [Scaptodrosophila lebanonensis]
MEGCGARPCPARCPPKRPACPKKKKKNPCKRKRKTCPKKKRPACPKKKKPACPKRKKPTCKPKKKPTCKPKCMRPGPIMNNGFLNFMREFRMQNCGLTAPQALKKGARAWCKLPECEKQKYRQMGCGVKPKKRKC